MGLSIITPHFNNFEGVKRIYECLKEQHNPDWEWLIVDDCSLPFQQNLLCSYFEAKHDDRILILIQDQKKNASICRNIGAQQSRFDRLIFLDSDDEINEYFVSNRSIPVSDFTVFKSMSIVTETGEVYVKSTEASNYLNCFLNAQFIWQTSCVLWDKIYFFKLGGFHGSFNRLQDVELMIRALLDSKRYQVINNIPDFYYHVKPIRERNNLVKSVCEAVYHLISDVLEAYDLDNNQRNLVKGYYFMCVKYLERSESRSNSVFVKPIISLFYQYGYFGYLDFILAQLILALYKNNFISDDLFLRLNRYFFKLEI